MKKYYEKKTLTIAHRDKYREVTQRLNAEEIAKLANVTEKTAYKWLNQTHKIDAAKLELIKIKALGIIPKPGWEGFFFDDKGNLVSRNGFSINSEQIGYFTLIKQLNSLLRIENAELKAEIETLKNKDMKTNVTPLRRETG